MATSILSGMTRPILLSAGLFLIILPGCYTAARDMNATSGYQQQVPQTYRTKIDLYLFYLDENDVPYMGINDGRPGYRARTLPELVSRSEIGKKFANGVIQAVVPAGAEFNANSVAYSRSPVRDKVWFEGELRYAGQRVVRVKTLFIQSNVDARDGRSPEIDPVLAERIK